MLSHKTFIIVIFLLVSSIALGVIAVSTFKQKCVHKNEVLCAALQKFEKESFTRVHGVYNETDNIRSLHVEWVLNEGLKHITYVIEGKETMNVVFTPEKVYVKDLSDNAWWEQSNDEMKKFDVQLQFDPETFLDLMARKIQKPEITFENPVFMQCPPLNDESCTRFTLHDAADPDVEEYVFIRKNKTLSSYSRKNGHVEKVFYIFYEKEDIDLPEYTKKPKAGQNVFLESTLNNPSEGKGLQLDYVREFQMEMGDEAR